MPRQAVPSRAAALPDTPSWVKAAVQHLRAQPAPTASGENGVSFPPADELPVTAALEKALGMPVKAVQGSSAAPAGTRGLILRLSLDAKSGTSWWLSKRKRVNHCSHSRSSIAGSTAYLLPACRACS